MSVFHLALSNMVQRHVAFLSAMLSFISAIVALHVRHVMLKKGTSIRKVRHREGSPQEGSPQN